MKPIHYLKCAYHILRPAGISYCATLIIAALASYIGANSQSRITAMIQSSEPSQHILPLLQYAVIGGICIAARGAIFTYLNKYLYTVLTTSIFQRIQSAQMETWDTEWTNSEITKLIMTDTDEVVEAVSLFCNVSVRTITTFVTVSYLWYNISPQSYLVGLTLCLTQLTVMQCIHPWYQQKAEATTAIKQKIEANINEYIQQHLSIILYSWQSIYQQIHTALRLEYINTLKQESTGYGLFLIALQVVPALGDIGMIYTLLQNNISVIHLVEIYSYYQSMISATNACKDQWVHTWKKRPQLERTWNILQKPICTENVSIASSSDISQSITFDAVTFRYPTIITPVFSAFSLEIQPGEHVFLKAPSGRGKTTLLKLLLGLYPIESGSIRIGDKDVSKITPPEMKQLVSIVPQEPFYDASRTIRENIMMGSTESVNVEALLDRVKLSELRELLDTRPATLSGGQKQRIAIARVFVKNTPIIILDEPTSALDKETEQSIIDVIHNYIKDKTVIWITHNDMYPNIKHIYL